MFNSKKIKTLETEIKNLRKTIDDQTEILRFIINHNVHDIVDSGDGVTYISGCKLKKCKYTYTDVSLVRVLENTSTNAILLCTKKYLMVHIVYKLDKIQNILVDITGYYKFEENETNSCEYVSEPIPIENEHSVEPECKNVVTSKYTKRQFAEAIRIDRFKRKFTLEQYGKAVGVSRDSIWRYERVEHMPRNPKVLQRIINYFERNK